MDAIRKQLSALEAQAQRELHTREALTEMMSESRDGFAHMHLENFHEHQLTVILEAIGKEKGYVCPSTYRGTTARLILYARLYTVIQ